ncbi:MAG: DUF2066 domain-containing protein [Alphaproteobacteria bacterium]|nr:DUF2066 domain-containing protein [Alphaproteobacteria bacterium]
MRLLSLLVLALIFLTSPVRAEDEMPVYRVADVIVDVTSGNASLARDMAIVQAQKQAFMQLMERLGVPGPVNTGGGDLGAFVQSFEIQKEHAAGVRYLGTFTVQFKPDMVRNYLTQKGLPFVEARPKPIVVLPILRSNGHDILWEDTTPWQAAWADVAKKAGLVPIIVPLPDLDDIAKIGASEAMAGTGSNLQAMMQKYEASGIIVALLQADLDLPNGKSEAVVDVYRYDFDAKPLEPMRLKLPTLSSPKVVRETLIKGVYQIIGLVERSWRQANKAPSGPSAFLPVDVAVPTLASWTQIRNKLKLVPVVAGAHVVTMTRGLVHVEVEYRGDVHALQTALSERGLSLAQNQDGGWELSDTQGGNE